MASVICVSFTLFSSVLGELKVSIQYVLYCLKKKGVWKECSEEEEKQMAHMLFIPLQETKGETTDNVAAWFSYLGPTEL